MNDDSKARVPKRDDESEQMLERLFAHARPRPTPPENDAEEIRRAVYEAWDASTRKRLLTRRTGFAAAASVVLAFALWVGFGTDSSAPLASVATVERIDGLVVGADGEALVVGRPIAAGDVLTATTGQVALRLASGGSLRLDIQTRVALTDAAAAELLAGQIYFDSEDERSGAPFTVITRLGSVRDVGTQFLARLDAGVRRFDVGVREGRVELTSGGETGAARSGERLTVTADAAVISRDEIATFGAEWEWTERLAPPFDIDGRTVEEFLDWFAAQTGRTVVFADPTVAQRARDSVLRGSIDLAPLPKLQAVLATTTLGYTVEGERVLISLR
jgi:hypothetical protein